MQIGFMPLPKGTAEQAEQLDLYMEDLLEKHIKRQARSQVGLMEADKKMARLTALQDAWQADIRGLCSILRDGVTPDYFTGVAIQVNSQPFQMDYSQPLCDQTN